jgi:hypothetical protein
MFRLIGFFRTQSLGQALGRGGSLSRLPLAAAAYAQSGHSFKGASGCRVSLKWATVSESAITDERDKRM